MAAGFTSGGGRGPDPFFRTMWFSAAFVAAVALLVGTWQVWAGLVVAIAGGAWLARSWTGALASLREVVARLGDDSADARTSGLHELARSVERARQISDRTQEELRKERDDFQGILRQTNDGILLLDSEQRVVRINEAAHRMLGTPPNALGRPLEELARNLDLLDLVERVGAGEETAPRRINNYSQQGDRVLRAVATRIADAGGEARVLVALHDTTDLRRLERVRTDFVANVTHEMRSPLASILGYAETLASDAERMPPDAVDALERIVRNAERLDRIISDLVELSRLEHATAPEPIPIDVRAYLEEITGSFADAAAEKGLELVVSAEDLPGEVALDRQLLAQALSNLIDNAVKYSTEGGTVEVSARTGDHQLEIDVRDEGPGIPREHQDRIFERFYRVDAARSRAVGGTGLGLAIAKHAAAVHGGQLTVDSGVGRGATFRLSLPWSGE